MSFNSIKKYESMERERGGGGDDDEDDDDDGGDDDDDAVTDAYLSIHKKTSIRRRLTKLMNHFDSSPSRSEVFKDDSHNVQFWQESCEDSTGHKIKFKCAKISNPVSLDDRNIKRLENVEKLEIEDSEGVMEHIPEALVHCFKNLIHLSLSWSKVKVIQKELMQSKLKCLKLNDNLIKRINNLDSLHQLQVLNLKNNHLIRIPKNICELHKLIQLDVSGNNIKELPHFFGNLKNLNILDLSRNKLKALPDSIGELKNLKVLNISNNILFSLNPALSRLSNLSDLQASSNQLNQLPLSFESLQALESISLSYNYFKNIPNCLCNLKRLKAANLRNNYIQLASEALSQISCLNLNNNSLKQLPDSILDSHFISDLYLNNNQLSSIPDSISQLNLLRVLHIDNNIGIKRLPNTLLDLPSLKHLSINNTNIPNNNLILQKLLEKGVSVGEISNINLDMDHRGATVGQCFTRTNCLSIFPNHDDFNSPPGSTTTNDRGPVNDDGKDERNDHHKRNKRYKTEVKRYGRRNILEYE